MVGTEFEHLNKFQITAFFRPKKGANSSKKSPCLHILNTHGNNVLIWRNEYSKNLNEILKNNFCVVKLSFESQGPP